MVYNPIRRDFNMYITEISLEDFVKLDKDAYEQTKEEVSETTFRYVYKRVEKIISDGNIEYAKEFEHKNIAVFLNECHSEKEAKEKAVWDKYYVRCPATFCVWAGVEHIYSQKGRWLVKADTEDGFIPKHYFDKVYLVHVGD